MNTETNVSKTRHNKSRPWVNHVLRYGSIPAISLLLFAMRSDLQRALMVFDPIINVERAEYTAREELENTSISTHALREDWVRRIIDDQADELSNRGWDEFILEGLSPQAQHSAVKLLMYATNNREETGLVASSNIMNHTDTRGGKTTEYYAILASGHQIWSVDYYSQGKFTLELNRNFLMQNSGQVILTEKDIGYSTVDLRSPLLRQDIGVIIVPKQSPGGERLSQIIDEDKIPNSADLAETKPVDGSKLSGVCFYGYKDTPYIVTDAVRTDLEGYLDFGMFGVDNFTSVPGICGCGMFNADGKYVGIMANGINPESILAGADNGLMTLFSELERDSEGRLTMFNNAIDAYKLHAVESK